MNRVNRWIRVLALTAVVLFLLASPSHAFSELHVERIGTRLYAGEGYMEIMGPLVFMHLKGSSYAMGVQHGALLAHLYPEDELLEMRAALDPLHAPVTGFAQLVQAFKQFYFQFKMAPWIRRNVPDDLGQEIDGILYGVSGGQDTDPMDIIMGNVYQDLGMAFGCTSVVAFGDATASGSLYHARNLDNLSMMDWAPYGYVVVYEPDRGYPFLTHIYPIHAGTMQAMNNQGITVSMNYSLVDQADNSLDGIAMVFLMRQIVQYASTLDEAVQIVLGSPRTFGMNIVISDSKIPDAVVLEVDANRYSIRRAKDGVLFAANRYNTEYMQQFQAPGWLSSARREERLAQYLGEHFGAIRAESMVELLRDRGEPGSAAYAGLLEGINNAGSMLSCVFSPEEQIMWVSVPDQGRGSPDGEFYAFSLARALAGEDPAVFSRNIAATTEDQNFKNWLLVREATLAFSQNRLTATLDCFDQLDPEFSDAEAALSLKARTQLRLGNQGEAQACFEAIAKRDQVAEPFYLQEALAILGSIHDSLGDRPRAVEYYQAALETEIPDLGGNASFYQELAEVGLGKPVYVESKGTSYSFSTGESAIVRFFKAPEATYVQGAGLYRQYDGAEIAQVRILGAHRTKAGVGSRVLQLEPGTSFDAAQFAAGKRRLEALGALDQVHIHVVPVSEDVVDIIVRISEGFGLYLDPVHFVIENILNLSNQSIAVRYYNLAGTLASIGGEYNFGPSHRRGAYLTFPLGRFPTTLRYQSQTINTKLRWGEHEGSRFSLDRQDLSLSSNVPLGEHSAIALLLGYSKSEVHEVDTMTGLTVPSREYWTLGTTVQTRFPGSTTWTQAGTTLQAGVSMLVNRFDLGERFSSAHFTAGNVCYLGKGFVSRVELEAAWTQRGTPFDRRLRLGGNGQLGVDSPIFVGEMYLHSAFELRRYFTPDLAAHFHVELAKVWEDGTKLDQGSVLRSVGVGLTYQTPIGLQVGVRYSKSLTVANTHSFGIGLVHPF